MSTSYKLSTLMKIKNRVQKELQSLKAVIFASSTGRSGWGTSITTSPFLKSIKASEAAPEARINNAKAYFSRYEDSVKQISKQHQKIENLARLSTLLQTKISEANGLHKIGAKLKQVEGLKEEKNLLEIIQKAWEEAAAEVPAGILIPELSQSGYSVYSSVVTRRDYAVTSAEQAVPEIQYTAQFLPEIDYSQTIKQITKHIWELQEQIESLTHSVLVEVDIDLSEYIV